jgi:hypothetical protein
MYTCRVCKRTFATELARSLHQDGCEKSQLFCQCCGDRFAEYRATRDGWNYACPNDDCDGEGLTEDILRIDDMRVATQTR